MELSESFLNELSDLCRRHKVRLGDSQNPRFTAVELTESDILPESGYIQDHKGRLIWLGRFELTDLPRRDAFFAEALAKAQKA